MDTPREIKRDEWILDHHEMCGTCRYHYFQKADTWFCDCQESERYGEYTDYNEGCEEYAERYRR